MLDTLSRRLDSRESGYGNSLTYLREMVTELIYNSSYHGKWYSYFEDMKKVSLLYPNQVIVLKGEEKKMMNGPIIS
jgi:hypothetical protein